MAADDKDTNGRKRRLLVCLPVSIAIAALVGFFFVAGRSAAPPTNPPPPVLLNRESYGRFPVDESCLSLLCMRIAESNHDRASLQSIRTAFHHLGYRNLETLRSLSVDSLEQRLDQLIQMALLRGYEGEFVKAIETLEEARQIANREPRRFAQGLPTLVFLQGLMSLRRGEVENCVECACQSSCIFPLQPQAFHQQREGSRQAVKYFTEYLQGRPDDIGVLWLLNVAYMTLGEYPNGVPEQYRIALDPFRSEFDIGRFVDLAPRLGLDCLHLAGGAIMDDFDNDGLLDLVETSMDPDVSMVFYRNQGDRTFGNRTKEAGLEGQLGGLNCVQTDYNNDGWLDLFVCRGAWWEPQRPSLLRNNKDGTFTDLTSAAGLLQPIDSQTAVWADYDNDGWLDLFVGGESVPSRLYHNRGDGTFEEMARQAGVDNKGFLCKGANWGDWDGDGYADLFVANNNGPPRLFHNNKDGTFTDEATAPASRSPKRPSPVGSGTTITMVGWTFS